MIFYIKINSYIVLPIKIYYEKKKTKVISVRVGPIRQVIKALLCISQIYEARNIETGLQIGPKFIWLGIGRAFPIFIFPAMGRHACYLDPKSLNVILLYAIGFFCNADIIKTL